jgi:hypothetical protein
MGYLAKALDLNSADVSQLLGGGRRYQAPPSQLVDAKVESRRERRVDPRYEPLPIARLDEVEGCGSSVAIVRDGVAATRGRNWVQLGGAQYDWYGYRLLRCEGKLLYALATNAIDATRPDQKIPGELFIWDVEAEATIWRTGVLIPHDFVRYGTKWTRASIRNDAV